MSKHPMGEALHMEDSSSSSSSVISAADVTDLLKLMHEAKKHQTESHEFNMGEDNEPGHDALAEFWGFKTNGHTYARDKLGLSSLDYQDKYTRERQAATRRKRQGAQLVNLIGSMGESKQLLAERIAHPRVTCLRYGRVLGSFVATCTHATCQRSALIAYAK